MKERARKRRRVTLLICILASLTVSGTAFAAEEEKTALGILMKLLEAVETADYDSFVADGNAVFKAGMTRQMLEGVSDQLAPRMKQGYQPVYLGRLRQQGCQVYLWKLVFKDGGDDTLAKLVLKDGKVAGFWLQ